MPINVTCQCGKQLAAPERLAGKRVKCPSCGNRLQIPESAEAGESHESSGADEGAAAPAQAGAGQAGAPRQAADKPGSKYREAVLSSQSSRAEAAAGKKWKLFELMGMDVTVPRLLVVLTVVIALPTWWFMGPGDEADVETVRAVHAVPALQSLDIREGYSLLTGQGDRSVGVKGPQPKNVPGQHPAATTKPQSKTGAKEDVVYSMGGGHRLFVTRPGDTGDHLLVRISMAQHLIEGRDAIDHQHKLLFRSPDFTVKPASGGAAIEPKLLYTNLGNSVDLDLAGAKTIDYAPLLPPGVPPSERVDFTDRNGGTATGTVKYNGENGVTGSVSFQSYRFVTGSPGVQGLGANGNLQLQTPANITANFGYHGGTMTVTCNDGSQMWWNANRFTKDPHWHPWTHYQLGLLFKPEPGQNQWQIQFKGKHILTVERPAASRSAQTAQQSAGQAQGQSQSASSAKQKSNNNQVAPTNVVGAYLENLARARKKAQGTVAASRMRQIGLALRNYAHDYNALPDNIEQIKPYVGSYDKLMTNPRTGKRPGYIYEKPEPGDNPIETPVLWEARGGTKYLSGPILFADGHIEGL